MANICSTDIYITGEHSEITALCKELWPASKVGWGVVDFLDLPTRFTYDEGEGCEITYMEEGEVKERGSHAQLMAASGGYAKLFNAQKQLEEGYKEITSIAAEVRA